MPNTHEAEQSHRARLRPRSHLGHVAAEEADGHAPSRGAADADVEEDLPGEMTPAEKIVRRMRAIIRKRA